MLPFPSQTLSVKDSLDFIGSVIQESAIGLTYGYGIIYNDEIVGHVSLMHVNDDKDPEIGYWVARKSAGKNIATKAAQAMVDLGFNELALKKIIIKVNFNNIGSNRVAEKLGFNMDRNEYDKVAGFANIWEKEKNIEQN